MKEKLKSWLLGIFLIVLFFSLILSNKKIQRLRIDKAGATKTLILSGYVPLSVGGYNGFRYFNGWKF